MPLVVVFLITAILILIFRNALEQLGFSWEVLSGGNLFLYIITVISLHLLVKGMDAQNTAAFMRNAYSGIMLKLFACAGAAFIYILVAGKEINKPALFGCMGLYIIYTYIEISTILKQNSVKRNGKS